MPIEDAKHASTFDDYGPGCCWHDLGDATCLLPDKHDGPHKSTPDNEIIASYVPPEVNTE